MHRSLTWTIAVCLAPLCAWSAPGAEPADTVLRPDWQFDLPGNEKTFTELGSNQGDLLAFIQRGAYADTPSRMGVVSVTDGRLAWERQIRPPGRDVSFAGSDNKYS